MSEFEARLRGVREAAKTARAVGQHGYAENLEWAAEQLGGSNVSDPDQRREKQVEAEELLLDILSELAVRLGHTSGSPVLLKINKLEDLFEELR